MDIRTTGDEALQRQVGVLQERLEAIARENDDLAQKLSILDPGGELQTTLDDQAIDRAFDHTDTVMAQSGGHVLLRLNEAVEKSGSTGFIRELRNVVKSPYLSLNDFLTIQDMCENRLTRYVAAVNP